MDVTVCVGTFGSSEWPELARTRAMPSAAEQRLRVVHHHGRNLADARNSCLRLANSEWVIFLDADDELEPGYAEAMDAATADLRAPAVRYVRGGRDERPRIPRVAGHDHACSADCLRDGNWLVVGTAVRAELVLHVGGWREWPLYEDWDLWLRCWMAGATVEAVPDAVYRAHWRADSRNRAPEMAFKNKIHREIVASNFDPDPVAA